MTDIKTIRQQTGLSQKAFAEKYGIPLRSIVNWETQGSNHRDPPQYVVELLKFKIEHE